jgi:hypothetical protein
MKYLKKFNESIEEQIYTQVLDRIKECFLEFEDNGWHWIADVSYPGISIWKNPNFNCRMIPKDEVYQPSDRRDLLDWTGEIDSDGEINWNTKELKGHNLTKKVDSNNKATWSMSEEKEEFKEGSKEREEAEDFLVAVKRLQSEIGIGFKFSYNNSGGEKRIVIQGSI